MKTNQQRGANSLTVQRVRVKGKPMVMLEEAAYESLLRKANFKGGIPTR